MMYFSIKNVYFNRKVGIIPIEYTHFIPPGRHPAIENLSYRLTKFWHLSGRCSRGNRFRSPPSTTPGSS